ncbi:flagellar basal-body rod modification protein [Herbaspirillum sp. GW103]|jgi:flagellar basal-body rod modification protein FlgD|uniref:flagellar hook assembly protein FlgD n=1 Tax=unclassified Herbaspirillum TaxID=2624150 RepID=UPI00025E40DB|nr:MULTISPECIES: flagellar hook assembly protein FlgD [unclassified Herbaspirillum]EIJ47222.1 flagellar basal-body rod modification protein [Herbaspirillum sp. GW103]MCI1004786.1 flagellar hook assembly protein FlgD [Herbaspirillum sp. C7C8]NUT59646.1 flagellar hook assembly protein FlgD [Herbaspirillum sp. C9C3]
MAIVSSDLLTAMNGTSSSSSTTTSSSSLDDNSPDAIQNRFLTLLIAQMKNQDPSNPMDNSQLTTQMAQLSTVSGISQLNNSLSTLMGNLNSSQALSTANMIGHSVLAPGNSIQLTSDTTKDSSGNDVTSQKAVFGVNLSGTASSVVVTIKDSTGAVVHTTDLGTQAAGVVPVIWDGTNNTGGKVADGNYTFTVSASNNGTAVSASTLSFGTVSSVSTASDGVKLNVSNIGTIKPTDVVQIL